MKLTIKDLRVGNAFIQKGGNFVEFVTIQDLVAISEGRKIVEGVPLTEEWLIKFGFEKKVISGFHITYRKGGLFLLKRFDSTKIWCDNIEVKYIHQLQNIFKALKKTELLCN